MEKGRILKELFSSEKDCGPVKTEEADVNKDKELDKVFKIKADTPCCSSKTE